MTSQEYLKLKSFHCDKGKHRYRENKYGVTWCVICGHLGSVGLPLKEEDKIIIKNF